MTPEPLYAPRPERQVYADFVVRVTPWVEKFISQYPRTEVFDVREPGERAHHFATSLVTAFHNPSRPPHVYLSEDAPINPTKKRDHDILIRYVRNGRVITLEYEWNDETAEILERTFKEAVKSPRRGPFVPYGLLYIADLSGTDTLGKPQKPRGRELTFQNEEIQLSDLSYRGSENGNRIANGSIPKPKPLKASLVKEPLIDFD